MNENNTQQKPACPYSTAGNFQEEKCPSNGDVQDPAERPSGKDPQPAEDSTTRVSVAGV